MNGKPNEVWPTASSRPRTKRSPPIVMHVISLLILLVAFIPSRSCLTRRVSFPTVVKYIQTNTLCTQICHSISRIDPSRQRVWLCTKAHAASKSACRAWYTKARSRWCASIFCKKKTVYEYFGKNQTFRLPDLMSLCVCCTRMRMHDFTKSKYEFYWKLT